METISMLCASLMSAAVGYVCGLIVGRDTRTTITIREQRSQSVAGEVILPRLHWPGNGTEPDQFPDPTPWGSARGSNPQWVSIGQDRPPDNGPLYATKIEGVAGWYFCTEARELGNGRLWMSRSYFHGKETVSWTCNRGEWMRCR